MRSRLPLLATLSVAAALLASGLRQIRANEQGVVFRFGRPVGKPLLPGLHFVLPLVDRVARVEVTRTYTMPVGFRLVDEVRGIPPSPAESQWLTGDTNILSVQASVQYAITDSVAYLTRAEAAQEVLRRAAESAVSETLARLAVDDAITTGRLVLLEDVQARTQALLDRNGIGVHVASMTLRALDPPPEVLSAFQAVQNARSDRERLINEARGYANDVVPKARGEAGAVVTGAQSDRDSRIAMARGDAERFDSVRRSAAIAPSLLRQRLYLEAVEKLLPRMQVYTADRRGRLRLVQPAEGGR